MSAVIRSEPTPLLSVALGASAFSSAIDAQQALTFEQLAELLRAHWHVGKLSRGWADVEAVKRDKNTRWFSLARFRAPVRNLLNVESVSGFVGDFDDGTWAAPETISMMLTGVKHLIYTTYSHGAERAKFRLVIPYAAPVSAIDHGRLWDHWNTVFLGALDGNAKDAPRLFYFPSSAADTTGLARWHVGDGALFNPVTVLPSLPPPAPPDLSPVSDWTDSPVPQWSGPPDTDEGDAELIAKARRSRSANAIFGKGASFANLYDGDAKLSDAYPPKSPGQAWDCSAADLALANHLAYWCGGNCDRIDRLMRQSNLSRPKHDRPDYMRETILKACASIAARGTYYNDGSKVPVTPGDTRPVIELKGGALEQNVAALLPLLADSIYVQGGSLVRIGHADQIAKTADGDMVEIAGIRRAAKQAVVIPVTADWLRLELMRRAQFWQYDERASRFKHKDCPEEIASTIVKQGSWSAFRQLDAISAVPVLRPDLSVCIDPGYDSVTRVYYQPTISIPAIIEKPTIEDARAALARLFEPFDQFPYASDVSKSVFVSHIITAVIRPSITTVPVFFYTAPVAETGKTLIAKIPQLIATGSEPAASPFSEGEELRKVLLASLMTGDTALLLDNIPNGWGVRSPELCGFVTSENYADRVLGVSKILKLPNCLTLALTGNNVTPESDVSRRSLIARLDVGAESARGREFRIPDLKAHVLEHRGQMIVDVFTIVRAYGLAGRPGTLKPVGSFERWSRLVRDPLTWLGWADPVDSQATETDDGVLPLRGAFAAIAAATAGKEFTSSQLAPLTTPQAPTVIGGRTSNTLHDALINAGCKEPAIAKTLGIWLNAQRDRVAGAWKLQGVKNKHLGVTVWQMVAPSPPGARRGAPEGNSAGPAGPAGPAIPERM